MGSQGQNMIGYHWSPDRNFHSIAKHGLLVPNKHPKLVVPVTCSEGHRNPHISLGRTPLMAYSLSVDMPWTELGWWNLYEVCFCKVKWRTFGTEIQVRQDIPRRCVHWIAGRDKR
jgi:hypothetical protein